VARWLVPKMVKNGLRSSFVYWSLIWACLMGNLDRVERWQIMEFQQILKKAKFFHNPLRLQLALLKRHAMQHGQKRMPTSQLSPNQKIRIKTI